MSRPNLKALILLVLALAVSAAPAYGSAGAVIRDCSADGVLDKHYSHGDLSRALDQLPSDLDEYTDCRSVIRRAQLAVAKGKGKDRPGILNRVDRTKPPNAGEQQSIDKAPSHEPVHVGGKPVQPGGTGAGFATSSLGTELPTFVLLVLIALGIAAVWGAAFAANRRWPGIGDGVKRGITRFRR